MSADLKDKLTPEELAAMGLELDPESPSIPRSASVDRAQACIDAIADVQAGADAGDALEALQRRLVGTGAAVFMGEVSESLLPDDEPEPDPTEAELEEARSEIRNRRNPWLR